MSLELSPALIEADDVLHDLFRRIPFSRHLNPTNSAEARRAFRKDGAPPRFTYLPATWADEELRRLDALRPPEDHPFGRILREAVRGTVLYIRALRDRRAEDFDALARDAGWYPDAALLEATRGEVRARDTAPFSVRADDLIDALRAALSERGLEDWVVVEDPVMSSRVLVDGAKRLLRVSPRAWFRERDVRRLIVHEVEVHAMRSVNGRHQPLRLFSTGLPGSLETEEGLALLAEELAGVASPATAWQQGVVVRAVDRARHLGFTELHEEISEEAPRLAWGVCQRLKRGLAKPDEPGVYAKDIVYYRGLRRVKAWLEEGNPLEWLYVGKVGVDDPVGDWLEAGLVEARPLPQVFRHRGRTDAPPTTKPGPPPSG